MSCLQISDESIIFDLLLQESHPVQVLQVVLGFRSVLEHLGNQDFLSLQEDLGCLGLEGRGLPSLRLHRRILSR